MRLVLVGPPGSGKGTLARRLVERHGLAYLGTGEILRDAMRRGTPLGKRVEPLLREGRFAPDDVMNEVVAERFRQPDRPDRFVMDGYPRTLAQAVSLDALLRQQFLRLDAALHLVLADDELVRRVGRRLSCGTPGCGASYHPDAERPRTAGVCDRCGKALYVRDDDGEAMVLARLASYQSNAEPLLGHYRRGGLVRTIAATGDAETVYEAVLAALGMMKGP